MVVGNPSAWAARFRTLDVRFLERVVAVWPSWVDVLADNPHEDTITANLVAAQRLLAPPPRTGALKMRRSDQSSCRTDRVRIRGKVADASDVAARLRWITQ